MTLLPLPSESQSADRLPDCPQVLVVDDDADMRAYCVDCLIDAYDVAEATDGLQALAAAQACPPRLIVSDVVMPRMDGYGLCHALQADPDLAHIPVLLITGEVGAARRLATDYPNTAVCLPKPFNARTLLRMAAHLLDDTPPA